MVWRAADRGSLFVFVLCRLLGKGATCLLDNDTHICSD
jgi:hypothetical protein